MVSERVQMCCIYLWCLLVWLALEGHVASFSVLILCRFCVATLAANTYLGYSHWKVTFASRKPRQHPESPSFSRRPDTVAGSVAGLRWAELPRKLQSQSAFRGGSVASADEVDDPAHSAIAALAANSPRKQSGRRGTAIGSLSGARADHLDMDHVRLSLWEYLWCDWFVIPPMLLGFLLGGPCSSGLAGVLLLMAKRNVGSAKKTADWEAECALVDFVTGSSLVLWTTRVEDKSDGLHLWLCIPDATHISRNEKVESGALELHLNVTSRRVLACKFGGQEVGKHDILALMFNAFAGHTHPLVHSFANWGINPSLPNAFLRRMAVVTIKYNNMGLESYPSTMQFIRWTGLASYITHDVTRLTCHMHHNVPNHGHLRRLQQSLPYVAFVVKVRSYFLEQFRRYQGDFKDIDGEALFVGTVLHSIDHSQAPYHIPIEHFAFSDSAAFDADHEWALWTISCFVDSPPGRLFEVRFSHAPHDFFRSVYKFAAQIDARLAGYMEACIAS